MYILVVSHAERNFDDVEKKLVDDNF